MRSVFRPNDRLHPTYTYGFVEDIELMTGRMLDLVDESELFGPAARRTEEELMDELFEEWFAMSGIEEDLFDPRVVRSYFEHEALCGAPPSRATSAYKLLQGRSTADLIADIKAFAGIPDDEDDVRVKKLKGVSAWHRSVKRALKHVGADPNKEVAVDPEVLSSGADWSLTATVYWGGVPYSETPRLAPRWVSTHPNGFLLAADLVQEGFELLGELTTDNADLRPALAKLEGSLAVLERMHRPAGTPAPPWSMMRCLRASILRLRQGQASAARDYLAPFIATQKTTLNEARAHSSNRRSARRRVIPPVPVPAGTSSHRGGSSDPFQPCPPSALS